MRNDKNKIGVVMNIRISPHPFKLFWASIINCSSGRRVSLPKNLFHFPASYVLADLEFGFSLHDVAIPCSSASKMHLTES